MMARDLHSPWTPCRTHAFGVGGARPLILLPHVRVRATAAVPDTLCTAPEPMVASGLSVPTHRALSGSHGRIGERPNSASRYARGKPLPHCEFATHPHNSKH